MSRPGLRMRQLVDWSAAVWAGVMAGLVFLCLNLFLVPAVLGGNAWVMVRLLASVVMGESILAPPATYDLAALIAAVVVNCGVTMAYALFIAYVIHRGGLVTGIIGGGVLGLAIYGLHFYAATYFYPWFFAFRGGVMMSCHILMGAVAGGIYEWLEVEEFVPVDEPPEEGAP